MKPLILTNRQIFVVITAICIMLHGALTLEFFWHAILLAICGFVFKLDKKHDGNDPETGRVLCQKALKLERQFKTDEALAAYDEIARRFTGHDVAKDAEISAEQIQKKLNA